MKVPLAMQILLHEVRYDEYVSDADQDHSNATQWARKAYSSAEVLESYAGEPETELELSFAVYERVDKKP
jgi:hypothetical protein